MKFRISPNLLQSSLGTEKKKEKGIPPSRRGEINMIRYTHSFFRNKWLIHVSNWSLRWQYGVIMINLFPSVIRHGFEFAWEIKYA